MEKQEQEHHPPQEQVETRVANVSRHETPASKDSAKPQSEKEPVFGAVNAKNRQPHWGLPEGYPADDI